MLEQGDLITLSNNKEYIVINKTSLKGKNYVYLITKDGISEIAICLFENDTLTKVTDIELLKILINIFKEQQEN